MKFEPQCKTISELYRELARVIELDDANGGLMYIPSMVKCKGSTEYLPETEPPYFKEEPQCYEFAIAIVEGQPVFRGDELYYTNSDIDRTAYKVKDFVKGHLLYCSNSQKEWYAPCSSWSWNPPKPKEEELKFKVGEKVYAEFESNPVPFPSGKTKVTIYKTPKQTKTDDIYEVFLWGDKKWGMRTGVKESQLSKIEEKPETVTIELTRSDAEWLVSMRKLEAPEGMKANDRIENAFRKALSTKT